MSMINKKFKERINNCDSDIVIVDKADRVIELGR